MKFQKLICLPLVFILIIFGVILFFAMANTEAKQDYFDGKVLKNSDDYIIIKINTSYEKLINKLGNTVKIEKKTVVKKCDFSAFEPDENVRVLYSGMNSKKHELKHIFSIYKLSEIQ